MDEIEKAMNKKQKEKKKQEERMEFRRNHRRSARHEEDRQSWERNPITNTVGFQRNGLVEESAYDPPSTYPASARDYLAALSRCGTLTGACKIAGLPTNSVYKWRKQLDGFYDEEDIAKYCFTDILEEDLFKCGLGMDPRVQGMARVKALDRAVKANRPEKYNDNLELEVDGNITWIDIIKQHADDANDKEGEES